MTTTPEGLTIIDDADADVGKVGVEQIGPVVGAFIRRRWKPGRCRPWKVFLRADKDDAIGPEHVKETVHNGVEGVWSKPIVVHYILALPAGPGESGACPPAGLGRGPGGLC